MAESPVEPAKPQGAPPNDAPEPIEIHVAWRVVAAAVSAAALTFGAIAVFATKVEAGPVALLAVGLIFGMITLAGVVPWKIKFGDTEIELRKVKKQNRALQDALADATTAALELGGGDRPSGAAAANPPELAASRVSAILDELALAAPDASTAVEMAVGYERGILRALEEAARKIGVQFDASSRFGPESGFDGVLRSSAGTEVAVVEIKASTAGLDRRTVDALLGRFASVGPALGAKKLLLITREHPRRAIGMNLTELRQLEWVVVKDGADADALTETVRRALNASD